jgi:hypothetical protein
VPLAVIIPDDGERGEFVNTVRSVSKHLQHFKPLPAEPYCFAEWRVCRVGVDDHVFDDRPNQHAVFKSDLKH